MGLFLESLHVMMRERANVLERGAIEAQRTAELFDVLGGINFGAGASPGDAEAMRRIRVLIEMSRRSAEEQQGATRELLEWLDQEIAKLKLETKASP